MPDEIIPGTVESMRIYGKPYCDACTCFINATIQADGKARDCLCDSSIVGASDIELCRKC